MKASAVAVKSDLEPALTGRQHRLLKRAHPHYEYVLACRKQAADRNPARCLCMIDPEIQPIARVSIADHLSTSELVGVVVIYMDAAGAHMHPECTHSDLWRCTRPADALLKFYWRHGSYPHDLRPYLNGGLHD